MWWLVPLALWLAWTGRGSSVDLSEAQSRGLQVALDEFHKHPPVQWAFQVTSVDIASDVPFPSGTFVRLEFKLQQTSCRKKDWKTVECGLKRNGVSAGSWGLYPAGACIMGVCECACV